MDDAAHGHPDGPDGRAGASLRSQPQAPEDRTAGKRPTLRDVAARAGVTKSTASRVLNEHPYVSAANRRAVIAAMEALEYAPNPNARSLRTRRTMTVGFVATSLSNEVFAAIAEGANQVLEPTGRTLLVGASGGDVEQEVGVIRQLVRREVDGLITTLADERDPSLRRTLNAARTPVVLLDRNGKGITADRVLTDHWTGVTAAAADLKRLGHERVALLCPGLNVRSGSEVAEAFRSVWPDGQVHGGPLTMEFGQVTVAGLLAAAARPTALVVCGTQVSVGALLSVREAGLSVPQDLSVVAYDESVGTRLYTPALSTITRDLTAMGEAAARLLLERVDGGRTSAKKLVLPTRYTARSSLAGPATATAASVRGRHRTRRAATPAD